MSDLIDRQAAIERLREFADDDITSTEKAVGAEYCIEILRVIPSAQSAPPEKYEYHYDHTDCIWYRPEARNRCPSTCAQYRDGWNDAMNYIYRDGKGYRPYRRGEQYGE